MEGREPRLQTTLARSCSSADSLLRMRVVPWHSGGLWTQVELACLPVVVLRSRRLPTRAGPSVDFKLPVALTLTTQEQWHSLLTWMQVVRAYFRMRTGLSVPSWTAAVRTLRL